MDTFHVTSSTSRTTFRIVGSVLPERPGLKAAAECIGVWHASSPSTNRAYVTVSHSGDADVMRIVLKAAIESHGGQGVEVYVDQTKAEDP